MTSEQEHSTVEISNIGYCFSPFIVRAEAFSGITGMDIVVFYNGENAYSESLQFNGEKEIRKDISGIMQAIFNYPGMIPVLYTGLTENTLKRFDFTISVYTTRAGEDHDFQNVTFVYGAVDYGRKYYEQNVNKKIKHFVNFPFGIDFLLSPGASIASASLKEPFKYQGQGDAIFLLMVDKMGGNYSAGVDNGGIEVNTMAYPYIDSTVLDASNSSYNVTVDTCTEGVYLMWVNREGMRSFYLFKNMGVTTTVEGEEYQKTLSYNTAYIENPKQVNKTAKKTITLAVAMADKEEYSYIESVLTSPEVYMYDSESNLFTKVNVVTGDFERTGAELQDFTFQIELPEEYTVKL